MALNLQQFREKYPMYDHLEDQDLADRLHAKFYSDMPKDEYYQKIQFQPTQASSNIPEEEEASIGQRIGQFLTEAKNKEVAAAKQYSENPMQYLKDAGQSFVDFSKGGSDTLRNIIASTSNIMPWGTNIPMAQSGSGTAYEAGKIGGELLGISGGGEILNAGRAAAESIPGIGALAKALGGKGFFSGLERRALGYGGYSALQNPDNPAESASGGAAISAGLDIGTAGLGAVGKVIAKGAQMIPRILSPSKNLRGSLPADILRENAAAARGTQTNLGSIIGNPFLKEQFETTLPKIPTSGAIPAMQQTAAAIDHDANRLVGRYLDRYNQQLAKKGKPPVESLNVEEELGKALINAFNAHTKIKSGIYNIAEDLADQEGLKLNLDSFYDKAKEYRDIINSEQFLKFEPKSKALMARLINYKEPQGLVNESMILDAKGNPIITKEKPSEVKLKEANILAGTLNKEAKKQLASVDFESRGMGKILGELGGTLKKDIRSSIKETGNEDLKNTFSIAEKNYAKNYSPFFDKEVYKFLGGDKNAEQIMSTFITTGKNTDQSIKLKKVLDRFRPHEKDLVRYAYLSRAMGGSEDFRSINPTALKGLWQDRNLGQRQKQALFPEKSERKELDRFSRLTHMNQEALGLMFNPKTGARGLHLLPYELIKGNPSIFSPEKFTKPGALILNALAGVGVKLGGAKALNHALTSPEIRERLIDTLAKMPISPTKTKQVKMPNSGQKFDKDKLLKDIIKSLISSTHPSHDH